MKKNQWMHSKSLLTFLSILSVILGFSLLCGIVMGLLLRFDVVELPRTDAENPGDLPEKEKIELPYHENGDVTLHTLTDGETPFDYLMPRLPFADSFYIKLHAENIENGDFPTGDYEIWKYGNKYRIHHYTADGEVVSMRICNGQAVQITDFTQAGIDKHPYTENDRFVKVSPLPDFAADFKKPHSVGDVTAFEDMYLVYCRYPEENRVDEVSFSKTTGFVHHYDRRVNGKSTYTVDLRTVDLQFSFDDYMFAFD